MRSTCIKEAVSLKVQFAIDRDENERLDLGIWAEIFHYIKHKEICTFSKTEDVDVSFILKKKENSEDIFIYSSKMMQIFSLPLPLNSQSHKYFGCNKEDLNWNFVT